MIARPIPTKRELKHICPAATDQETMNCKAHPDEKGIETPMCLSIPPPLPLGIARPIPTKRELKHGIGGSGNGLRLNCKAHPDEKGIETGEIGAIGST